jgi:hypothetical protein
VAKTINVECKNNESSKTKSKKKVLEGIKGLKK